VLAATAKTNTTKNGSTANSNSSNNSNSHNNSNRGGSNGFNHEMDPGARDVAKPLYNFLFGNDYKILTNPNSSLAQKGTSAFFLATTFTPAKALKGLKVADELADASKVFSPNQAALIELAKDAKRTGVSMEDAKTLLQWADEYKVSPALDHTGINAHEWKYGFDHIRIGPINHIQVK
jgi:SpoU rRNA methylase family enzyme